MSEDIRELWQCDICKGQWYVPDDFDQTEECPLCGREETTRIGWKEKEEQ